MAGTKEQWSETAKQGYFRGVLFTAVDMKREKTYVAIRRYLFLDFGKLGIIFKATNNRYELITLTSGKDRSLTS